MKKRIIYFGLFIFLNTIFGCTEQVFDQYNNPVQNVLHLKSATSKYYYVSPNGSDTNDGLSMATPWKTIARINQQASFYPGDIIHFEAGATYIGQLAPKGSGSNGDPIRVTKYGTASSYPCINGNGAYGAAIALTNQEYWEFQYLEIKNPATNQDDRHGFKVVFNDFGTGDHIYILNCSIHDVDGIYSSSARHQGTGIFFYCSGSSIPTKVNDIKIEGCLIWAIKKTGILFWSTWNKSSSNYTPSTNVLIKNNVLTYIFGDGMLINTCDGAVLQYNEINNANANTTVPSAGMWPHQSDNVIMEYNEAHNIPFGNGDGQGFDFDIQSRWCVSQYNYSHNNGGGFHLICTDGNVGITESNVIRFNISVNDHGNIFYFAGPAENTYIYHNTIFVKSGLSTGMYHYANWNGWANNTHSYNNIFCNQGSGGYNFGNSTNCNFMYNCFYGNHPSSEPYDAHKVTGDPKFVSPGIATDGLANVTGYKLMAGSSCYQNAMYEANGGGLDYFGNTYSSSPTPNRGFYNGALTYPLVTNSMPTVIEAESSDEGFDALVQSWWRDNNIMWGGNKYINLYNTTATYHISVVDAGSYDFTFDVACWGGGDLDLLINNVVVGSANNIPSGDGANVTHAVIGNISLATGNHIIKINSSGYFDFDLFTVTAH